MYKENYNLYQAIHRWVRSRFGSATMCENADCNKLPCKRYHWANISGEYKKERSDWKQLCPRCHTHFDGHLNYKDNCKRGHSLKSGDVRIRIGKDKLGNPREWRICRECERLREANKRLAVAS